MSENIRNRNGKAFNFINGLKVKNVNIEGPMGSTVIGYNGTTVKQTLDNVGLSITQNNNAIVNLGATKADKTQITTLEQSKADKTEVVLKANIESPAFTGTPSAPTPSPGDDSGKLATTEFVNQTLDSYVAAVVNGGTGASNVVDARDNLDVYSKSESDELSPSAKIAYFARATAPVGWLIANGAAVSRSQYPDLFAAMGTLFGPGDGVNTFNLPNLCGEFIRGLDLGRGIDPGRALGSIQEDRMQDHYHGTGDFRNESNDDWFTIIRGWAGSFVGRQVAGEANSNSQAALSGGTGGSRYTGTTDQQLVAGSETRPRNIALLPCIKI